MKINTLIFSLLLIASFHLHAQPVFSEGYFIDNDNNKTNCLIAVTSKKSLPSSIQYRLTEAGEILTVPTQSIKELLIAAPRLHYRRMDILIDRSADDIKELDTKYQPDLKKENHLLKLTVEGKASLFSYYEGNDFKRFFIALDNKGPEQLVYKKYLFENNKISENNSYKQQLFIMLNCGNNKEGDFSRLRYDEKSLSSAVVQYNKCGGYPYTNNFHIQKGEIHFAVKAGINYSYLSITQLKPENTTEFKPNIGAVISAELEYLFPKSKKWGVVIDPGFQYYKIKDKITFYGTYYTFNPGGVAGRAGDLTANYSHLKLPVGARRYLTLNDQSSLFLNGFISYNFLLATKKAFKTQDGKYIDVKQESSNLAPAFALGGGYVSKSGLRIDLTYDINKWMLNNVNWKVGYKNSFNIQIGYRLK